MAYPNFITSFFIFSAILFTLYNEHLSAASEVPTNYITLNLQNFVRDKVCLHGKDSNTTPNPRTISSTNNIIKFDLYHVYGPCSPLFNATQLPSYKEQENQQIARVKWLQHKAKMKNKTIQPMANDLPITPGNPPHNSGSHIVKLKVSSSQIVQHVLFDLGSDITWIQSKPCEGLYVCYDQDDDYHNRPTSHSFSHVRCDDHYCKSLPHHQCIDDKCVYKMKYVDGSKSKGYLAKETLYLNDRKRENIYIGCGISNRMKYNERLAGIIGLNRAPISIISQTNSEYHSVFSYCLPSINSHHPGHLTLGNHQHHHGHVQYIQMLNGHDNNNYYVHLVGISVAGVRLPIHSTVFTRRGTMLDSGSSITWLPHDAYKSLRDAFKQHMRQYRTAQPTSRMDTCYDMRGVGDHAVLPSIALYFDGNGGHHEVSIQLSSKGVLISANMDGDKSRVCLAFTDSDDNNGVSLIGNAQLQTFDVIHDVHNRRIGFKAGGCE